MNNQTDMIDFFEFLEALNRHHEIEFTLSGKQYFATPITDPPEPTKYAVLEVETKMWIFKGTINELLHHRFDSSKTFVNHYTEFHIDFIL